MADTSKSLLYNI